MFNHFRHLVFATVARQQAETAARLCRACNGPDRKAAALSTNADDNRCIVMELNQKGYQPDIPTDTSSYSLSIQPFKSGSIRTAAGPINPVLDERQQDIFGFCVPR
jgi:hypothetical protein